MPHGFISSKLESDQGHKLNGYHTNQLKICGFEDSTINKIQDIKENWWRKIQCFPAHIQPHHQSSLSHNTINTKLVSSFLRFICR